MAASVLSESASASIKSLLDEYNQDTTQVVPVQQKIAAILWAEKAVSIRKLEVKQVVPHKDNRDKQMITASGTEMRAARLKHVGYAKSLYEEGAWAFEDNPKTKVLATTAMLHFKTDKRFAQYRQQDIVAGSVGASHTTHVHASVIDESPCSNPKVAVDGRYSKSDWYKNPEFKDVCENGSNWKVVKWEVEEMFPLMPIIFQAAVNTTHHVAEGDIILHVYVYIGTIYIMSCIYVHICVYHVYIHICGYYVITLPC